MIISRLSLDESLAHLVTWRDGCVGLSSGGPYWTAESAKVARPWPVKGIPLMKDHEHCPSNHPPVGVPWSSLATVGKRSGRATGQMTDEILTVPGVAKLLKVAVKTVYTMAQRGEIPCFKVRGQWRFRRQDLDTWIASQIRLGRPDDGDQGTP